MYGSSCDRRGGSGFGFLDFLIRRADDDVADLDVGGGGDDMEDGVGDILGIEHAHGLLHALEDGFAAAEIGVHQGSFDESRGDGGDMVR